jgi:PTH1 family peptidyl-tRNA hydrolase
MQKFLIAGLGNIGAEYELSRHNIGFLIADALAEELKISFKNDRLAAYAEGTFRGKKVYIIKPSTYMNLSGNALRYWLKDLNIETINSLTLVDDLALPFGEIRIKSTGSDAGHNGLKSIQEVLGTQKYPRLRFGIGNNYEKGRQVDYVLGSWNEEEIKSLSERIPKCIEAIKEFMLAGLDHAMSKYNGKL